MYKWGKQKAWNKIMSSWFFFFNEAFIKYLPYAFNMIKEERGEEEYYFFNTFYVPNALFHYLILWPYGFRLSSPFGRWEQRLRKFRQLPEVTTLLTNRARVSIQIYLTVFYYDFYDFYYDSMDNFKLCNIGLLWIIPFIVTVLFWFI